LSEEDRPTILTPEIMGILDEIEEFRLSPDMLMLLETKAKEAGRTKEAEAHDAPLAWRWQGHPTSHLPLFPLPRAHLLTCFAEPRLSESDPAYWRALSWTPRPTFFLFIVCPAHLFSISPDRFEGGSQGEGGALPEQQGDGAYHLLIILPVDGRLQRLQQPLQRRRSVILTMVRGPSSVRNDVMLASTIGSSPLVPILSTPGDTM
jgi:hypothetical protein